MCVWIALPRVVSARYKNIYKNDSTINDDTVDPGWVLLKKDKPTNKIVVKYGSHKESRPQNYTENIINSLVEINEKHKKEFIYLWGEDEYEKTFLFPNYDYDYFNKLDELYEEEMELLYQEEMEEAKLNDYVNTGYFDYY